MISLHRKYRPQTVAELDQERIRKVFEQILKTGSFNQAYLFTGPKGTGKTSGARILAKILNCETNQKLVSHNKPLQEPCNKCEVCKAIISGTSPCVMEMDGASNRKIDDIRALREQVALMPTQGSFAVYIIDEVHMLTTEAFNALLKTLEEPPAHVVFCLCTTELHKLPQTIVSRCSVVEIAKSDQQEIIRSLTRVAQAEKLQLTDEAAQAIAAAADGSFRDAMNILQAAMGQTDKIDLDQVNQVVYQTDEKIVDQLLESIYNGHIQQSLEQVSQAINAGSDLVRLSQKLLETALAQVRKQVIAGDNPDQIHITFVEIFSQAFKRYGQVPIASLPLEMAIVEFGLKTGRLESQTSQLKPPPTSPVAKPAKTTKTSPVPLVSKTTPTPKIKPVISVPPKPATASSHAQIVLEEVKKHWQDVLTQVSQHNHGLVTFLKRGQLVSCEENILQLTVSYEFHKDQLQQERHLQIIEAALLQVLGVPVRFVVALDAASVVPASLQNHHNITSQVPQGDQELVSAVEEAFGL